MDEKLDVRFCNDAINAKFMHILHFCLRKEVKNLLMQASQQNLNFVYLQKIKILILYLLSMETILPRNQI